MPKAILLILGIVAGIAIAVVGFSLGELYGAMVFPFPEGFDKSSMEEIKSFVATCPSWLLASFVPIWGLTAFLASWVAGRIGGLIPAIVVAVLWVAGVILNVSNLPYPTWFEIVIILSGIAAGAAGCWLTKKRTQGAPISKATQ